MLPRNVTVGGIVRAKVNMAEKEDNTSKREAGDCYRIIIIERASERDLFGRLK